MNKPTKEREKEEEVRKNERKRNNEKKDRNRDQQGRSLKVNQIERGKYLVTQT